MKIIILLCICCLLYKKTYKCKHAELIEMNGYIIFILISPYVISFYLDCENINDFKGDTDNSGVERVQNEIDEEGNYFHTLLYVDDFNYTE